MKSHNTRKKQSVSLRVVAFAKRLQDLISHTFEGDEEIMRYAPKNFSKVSFLARWVINDLQNRVVGLGMNVSCYSVYLHSDDDETYIGYAVVGKFPQPVVYSFGIRHEYRKREFIGPFLEALAAKFEGGYYGVMLPAKNTRAIRFWEKNGYRQGRKSSRGINVILCPQTQ